MQSRWQPSRRQYRILTLALALAAALGGAVALTPTASGQASVGVDGLSVTGTNQTVESDVSDVRLAATLGYEHSVPDAERRIVRLRAGPSRDDLALIDYTQESELSGTASGSVALAGSLLDHPDLTAADFAPGVANTSSQEIVIQAVIEVRRAGGEAVTHTATDTATVTLTDATELTVAIGGDGEITVETAE